MREIRFRFWNGTKMFYDLENVFECLKQQCSYNEGKTFPIPYDHVGLDGAVFMQYTGIKDKNGADIYEGDLVIWDTMSGRVREVKFVNGSFVMEYRFTSEHRKHYGFFDNNIQSNELLKVGSVHETPELLYTTASPSDQRLGRNMRMSWSS